MNIIVHIMVSDVHSDTALQFSVHVSVFSEKKYKYTNGNISYNNCYKITFNISTRRRNFAQIQKCCSYSIILG